MAKEPGEPLSFDEEADKVSQNAYGISFEQLKSLSEEEYKELQKETEYKGLRMLYKSFSDEGLEIVKRETEKNLAYMADHPGERPILESYMKISMRALEDEMESRKEQGEK